MGKAKMHMVQRELYVLNFVWVLYCAFDLLASHVLLWWTYNLSVSHVLYDYLIDLLISHLSIFTDEEDVNKAFWLQNHHKTLPLPKQNWDNCYNGGTTCFIGIRSRNVTVILMTFTEFHFIEPTVLWLCSLKLSYALSWSSLILLIIDCLKFILILSYLHVGPIRIPPHESRQTKWIAYNSFIYQTLYQLLLRHFILVSVFDF
jgi:hypothetical protein